MMLSDFSSIHVIITSARHQTSSTMSNSDSPLPVYLYKLIPSNTPPPDPLPEELPLSELDKESGFIHLSAAPQVSGTLSHFFGDQKRVYILKIPFQPLQEKIRWESPDKKGIQGLVDYQLPTHPLYISVCGSRPGEGLFPHLYDGRLGKNEVEHVITLDKGSSGWDEIIEQAKSSWLIY